MSKNSHFPTLAERATALLVNIIIFYTILTFASGYWLPTGGIESVWFLSALALWFLSLLSAPWFVPPRDALANSIGSIAILVTIELSAVTKFHHQLEILRWLGVAYCASVAGISLLSLFLHDRDPQSARTRLCFRLTSTFGEASVLYTFPALISIVGAYAKTP